ncbi:hypothetical protein RRG08_063961 [Elysia crispata]|uniref:Uncharacterized protein n=1 Tax=Elysia crispata TaxID=231223 RepID=A0AAE1CXF7_9GAST|nr:hypothetical protein RRG08_063961 [Elysia crispata]
MILLAPHEFWFMIQVTDQKVGQQDGCPQASSGGIPYAAPMTCRAEGVIMLYACSQLTQQAVQPTLLHSLNKTRLSVFNSTL